MSISSWRVSLARRITVTQHSPHNKLLSGYKGTDARRTEASALSRREDGSIPAPRQIVAIGEWQRGGGVNGVEIPGGVCLLDTFTGTRFSSTESVSRSRSWCLRAEVKHVVTPTDVTQPQAEFNPEMDNVCFCLEKISWFPDCEKLS